MLRLEVGVIRLQLDRITVNMLGIQGYRLFGVYSKHAIFDVFKSMVYSNHS